MIGIWDRNAAKKLLHRSIICFYFVMFNITTFTTIAAFVTPLWLALLHYNALDFIIYGISWAFMDGIWAYFSAGIAGSVFGVYLIVCYYLKLRMRQINRYIDSFIKIHTIDKEIVKTLKEHNKVCLLIENYNAFWSKYIFIIFFLYIPNNAFLLYNFIYEKLDIISLAAITLVLTEILVIVIAVALSGGSVAAEVNHSYTKLCSISTHSMPIKTRIKV